MGPPPRTWRREIFGELQADAAGALENLRDLARGIYPGGRLEVRSARGQGTTITGHLPVSVASGP